MQSARLVAVGLAGCLAAACRGSSTAPTSTPSPVTIATGPQVLRVTNTGLSCTIDRTSRTTFSWAIAPHP